MLTQVEYRADLEAQARIDAQEVAQEMRDSSIRATVAYWKKMSASSRYESDLSKEIERKAFDYVADPYEFIHLALLAQLSGKGAEFLEAQLKALATCEVDHE